MHVGDLLSIFAAPYTSNLIPVWNVPYSEIFSNSSKTSNCRGWINASLISKKVNRQKGQFGGRRNGIIVSFPINQVQRTQHRRYDVGLWFVCASSAIAGPVREVHWWRVRCVSWKNHLTGSGTYIGFASRITKFLHPYVLGHRQCVLRHMTRFCTSTNLLVSKLWMNRRMFKPVELTTRQTSAAINRLNNALPLTNFPQD